MPRSIALSTALPSRDATAGTADGSAAPPNAAKPVAKVTYRDIFLRWIWLGYGCCTDCCCQGKQAPYCSADGWSGTGGLRLAARPRMLPCSRRRACRFVLEGCCLGGPCCTRCCVAALSLSTAGHSVPPREPTCCACPVSSHSAPHSVTVPRLKTLLRAGLRPKITSVCRNSLLYTVKHDTATPCSAAAKACPCGADLCGAPAMGHVHGLLGAAGAGAVPARPDLHTGTPPLLGFAQLGLSRHMASAWSTGGLSLCAVPAFHTSPPRGDPCIG